MSKTLLIMAAGMASRFGGGKQTAQFGPNGEMLMEYSIADARRAGFDKVAFIIAPSMAETFPELIKSRVNGIELSFAVQSMDTLPGGFTAPEGRTKPYGTVHAVLCAKDIIDGRFAVINADDYYGPRAFEDMSKALDAVDDKNACMLAYPIGATISSFGSVTRGICKIDENACLTAVKETYKVQRCEDGKVRSFAESEEGEVIEEDAPASMNLFGFTPAIFDLCSRELSIFLNEKHEDEMKAEYPLPIMLDKLIRSGELSIHVTVTDSQWMGVTYQEDREMVENFLKSVVL